MAVILVGNIDGVRVAGRSEGFHEKPAFFSHISGGLPWVLVR